MRWERSKLAWVWLLIVACASDDGSSEDDATMKPVDVAGSGSPAGPQPAAAGAPAPTLPMQPATGGRSSQPSAAGSPSPSTPRPPAPAPSPMAGPMPQMPAPSMPTPDGVVFPGASWETKSPADAGFDGAKLEATAAGLLTSLPGRQCFAVFRNGYLVYEKYYTGDEHTLNAGFSTSKSFGATLVGIAVTQGLFTTEDLVSTLLPMTTVGPNVKIKHLLTMTGHLEPPGTAFDYAMGQMLLGNLANAIATKSGKSIGQFFEQHLKGPLEMQDIDWGGGRFVSFAGNVSTTCRDGARLGHLWANRGSWKGQKLISDQYFQEATTAAFPMANAGYGYNFWLNVAYSRARRVGLSFAAMGANGQYIVIIPELQLVVTSYGNDPQGQMSGAPSLISGVLEALL